MSNRRINYTLGFNADVSGLNQLKTQLMGLQNITQKDLKLFNPTATKAELQKMQTEVQRAAQIMGTALESAYNPSLNTLNITKFNQTLNQSTTAANGAGMSIRQMEAAFNRAGVQGKNAFLDLTSQVLTTQRAVRQTSSFLSSMATTFFNTLKWSVASAAIQGMASSVRNAWEYTKKLDESLNNIRIVTGKGTEEMEQFAKKANSAAKNLGAATTAYTDAALIYYQQGLDGKDVEARAEVTIKAANVTGQTAQEVSEQLTAVWNGYKVASDEAESYIDKLAAVAASTASDLQELSEGMQKVASGANAMGVDIDQLTAALSTTISATRLDAAAVGTAFKTIFARMGDLQVDGIDEFGVKLGDVSGKLKTMGIDVLDQEGNLRNMGDVITEVGEKWGTWTRAQQQAAAVAMAGKRQYNNLIALFENWDMYESSLATSQNAEGTLQKQQDIYMDSIEGHLAKVKTAGEGIYDAIFDSESMKDFVTILEGLLISLDNFITGIGGGGNLILMLGSSLASLFNTQIAGGIARIISNVGVWRDGIAQTRAELEITTKFSELQGNAARKLVDMKAQGLKYGKLMTEAEGKELDSLIQQTAELEKQKNIEKDKLDKANAYYKQYSGNPQGNITNLNEKTRAEVANKMTFKADTLDKRLGRVADASVFEKDARVQKAAMAMKSAGVDEVNANSLAALGGKNIGEAIGALQKDQGNLTGDELQKNQAKIQALQTLQKEEQKYGEITNQTKQKLENLTKETALNNDSRARIEKTIKKLEKGEISTSEAQRVLTEETKKYTSEMRTMAGSIKTGDTALKKVKGSLEKASSATKSFFKQMNTKAMVSGIVQGISAIGQLGSAIMSFANLGDIWADESSSIFEKVAQTLSAVGMAASMLAFSIGGIGKAYTSVAVALVGQNSLLGTNILLKKAKTQQEKEEILSNFLAANAENLYNKEITETNRNNIVSAALTELKGKKLTAGAIKTAIATASEKELGKQALKTGAQGLAGGQMMATGWLAAMGPIGWIIAAVVALTGLVIGLIAAFGGFDKEANKATKEAQEALHAAREAAQKFTEALKEAKEEYKNLTDQIKKYRDSLDALSKLREGTEEWKNSIIELNEQVLELMNKYPKLAEFIKAGENGAFEIQQEGLDLILGEQQEEIEAAQLANIAAQAKVYEKSTGLQQAQARDAIYNEAMKDRSQGGWNIVADAAHDGLGGAAVGAGIGAGVGASIPIFGPILAGAGALAGAAIGGLVGITAGTIRGFVEKGNEEKAHAKAVDKLTSDEFTQKLADLREKNPDLFVEVGSGDNINKQSELYELLDTEFEDAGLGSEKEDFIKAIIDNTEELEESVDALNQQKLATKALNQSYLRTFAQKYGIEDENTFVDITLDDLGAGDIDPSQFVENYKYGIGDNNYTGSNERDEQAAVVNDWIKKAYGADAEVLVDGKTFSADSLTDINKQDDFNKLKFTINGVEVTGEQLINQATTVDVERAIEQKTQTDANILKALENSGLSGRFAHYLGNNNTDTWTGKTLDQIDALLAEDGSQEITYFDATKQTTVTKTVGELKEGINQTRAEMENAINSTIANVGEGYKLTQNSFSKFSKDALFTFEKNLEAAELAGGETAKNALLDTFSNFADDPAAMKFINDVAETVDWTDSASVSGFISQLEEAGYYVDLTNTNWTNLIKNVNNGITQWVNGSQNVIDKLKTINEIAKDISLGDIISEEDYKKLLAINPAIKDSFIKTADGYKALVSGSTLEKELKGQFNSLSGIKDYYEKVNGAAKGYKYDADLDLNKSTDTKDYFNQFYKDGVLTENAKTMLAAAGYSEDTINNAYGILTDSNADTSSAEYQAALEVLQNAGGKVNNILGEVEGGLWNSKTAQEIWASTIATSWSEVAAAGLDEDISNKAQKDWRNRYLTELGFETETLLDGLGMETLQTYAENFRKLELNYYEDAERKIDRLGEAIDKAFGDEKIELLKNLAMAQKDYLDIAKTRRDMAQSNYNSIKMDLADFKLSSDASLSEILNKQAEYSSDSPEYKKIQAIVDAYTLAEDTADEFNSAISSLIDAELQIFDATIEAHLDLEEAKIEWEEFKANYLERSRISILTDLNGTQSANLAKTNFDIYETTFESYKDLLNAADVEKLFEKDPQRYKELADSATESYENMAEAAKEYLEAYSTIQEEIMEAYDAEISKISNINDLYTSMADLVKLVGKNTEEYGNKLTDYYSSVTTNAYKAKEIADAQLEAARQAYNTDYANATDEQKKMLEENLNTATSNAIEKAKEFAEALSEELTEALTITIDKAFEAATGKNLTKFSEEWERSLYFDERYLDDVNRAYNMDSFSRKLKEGIELNSNNIAAQNKINDLRERELKILDAKEKLTKADFDRANARYELLLKQIALEEAQQTASKLKLTRDARGNYSYEYVADQDKVAKAEEELAKAENDLYNLSKDQEKETIQLLVSKYQEAIEAIGGASTPEEKAVLNDYYFGSNGVITNLEKDLGAIGSEGALTETYTGPYKDTIEKLLAINPENIQQQNAVAINNFGTEFNKLSSSLTELLGEEGAIVSSIESLEDAISTPNTSELQTAATSILDELTKEGGLLATLQNYAADLKIFAEKSIDTMQNQALLDNTEATKALTRAMYYMADMADEKGFDYQINETKYVVKDDGSIDFDQPANGPTD